MELGLVGVGMIGTPMAERLLAAGHTLTIADIDETKTAALAAKGATVVASPKAVADAAETVLVSLPLPPIVREVALGENGLARGSRIRRYVDLSTTGSMVAREVAAGLSARDIACLDCPVSGGIKGAVEGTLALMLSGPKDVADALDEVLRVLGKPFYLGAEPGLGQTMKCANNTISATIAMVVNEALASGAKAGLDPSLMVDVLNAGAARSWQTENKFPELVREGRTSNMVTRLLHKDVSLFVEEARAAGVPTFVASTTFNYLTAGLAQGYADEPSSAMIGLVETWAGVQIRKKR